MSDLVEPRFKTPGKPSPQKQRKAAKRRELSESAEEVVRRNGGRCEICDDAPGTQVHHRAGRKVPGANNPEMLLHLCLYCHQEVHANPAHSYEQGYLIKPSTVTGPPFRPLPGAYDHVPAPRHHPDAEPTDDELHDRFQREQDIDTDHDEYLELFDQWKHERGLG